MRNAMIWILVLGVNWVRSYQELQNVFFGTAQGKAYIEKLGLFVKVQWLWHVSKA